VIRVLPLLLAAALVLAPPVSSLTVEAFRVLDQPADVKDFKDADVAAVSGYETCLYRPDSPAVTAYGNDLVVAWDTADGRVELAAAAYSDGKLTVKGPVVIEQNGYFLEEPALSPPVSLPGGGFFCELAYVRAGSEDDVSGTLAFGDDGTVKLVRVGPDLSLDVTTSFTITVNGQQVTVRVPQGPEVDGAAYPTLGPPPADVVTEVWNGNEADVVALVYRDGKVEEFTLQKGAGTEPAGMPIHPLPTGTLDENGTWLVYWRDASEAEATWWGGFRNISLRVAMPALIVPGDELSEMVHQTTVAGSQVKAFGPAGRVVFYVNGDELEAAELVYSYYGVRVVNLGTLTKVEGTCTFVSATEVYEDDSGNAYYLVVYGNRFTDAETGLFNSASALLVEVTRDGKAEVVASYPSLDALLAPYEKTVYGEEVAGVLGLYGLKVVTLESKYGDALVALVGFLGDSGACKSPTGQNVGHYMGDVFVAVLKVGTPSEEAQEAESLPQGVKVTLPSTAPPVQTPSTQQTQQTTSSPSGATIPLPLVPIPPVPRQPPSRTSSKRRTASSTSSRRAPMAALMVT